MFKHLDTVVSSDDDEEEQINKDDQEFEAPRKKEGSSFGPTQPMQEEVPVQTAPTGDAEIPVPNPATGESSHFVQNIDSSPCLSTADQEQPISEVPLTSVDEVVKSMTNFDLGDRSQDMDQDQSSGPKTINPETGHTSPSGHPTTPSSSKLLQTAMSRQSCQHEKAPLGLFMKKRPLQTNILMNNQALRLPVKTSDSMINQLQLLNGLLKLEIY